MPANNPEPGRCPYDPINGPGRCPNAGTIELVGSTSAGERRVRVCAEHIQRYTNPGLRGMWRRVEPVAES